MVLRTDFYIFWSIERYFNIIYNINHMHLRNKIESKQLGVEVHSHS